MAQLHCVSPGVAKRYSGIYLTTVITHQVGRGKENATHPSSSSWTSWRLETLLVAWDGLDTRHQDLGCQTLRLISPADISTVLEKSTYASSLAHCGVGVDLGSSL
jgi:hypothetical protein